MVYLLVSSNDFRILVIIAYPMSKMVAVGEELMPHRETEVASSACDLASKQVS